MNIPESVKTTPKTQLLIAFIIGVEALSSLYGAIIVPTMFANRYEWLDNIG